jgi:hypothetical protein
LKVIEKQDHRVGGVEKHRRVHVIFLMKGEWATAVASGSEVLVQHDAVSGLAAFESDKCLADVAAAGANQARRFSSASAPALDEAGF